MKTPLISLLLGLFWLPHARATDTLTIEQVRQQAMQHSPWQEKKLLAESIATLQRRNLQSNNLPRISIGAQATWQSDVFGLPLENPAFAIPEVPKDQYKLSVDVSQRLWDGGSDRFARRQRAIERDLTIAQAEVDVFQVREVVTELFFKILLLDESERVLDAAGTDLQNRLRQSQAAVAEGAALRTTADQWQIQLWKNEQQFAGLQADRQALLEILAVWLGRDSVDFVLRSPLDAPPTLYFRFEGRQEAPHRPEYRLLEVQKSSLQLQSEALALRRQPRVEAFVQGGLGRPNPFNFFETGFEPFALLGLRAQWTPLDWGNLGREREVLRLQMQSLDFQRRALDQRLSTPLYRDLGEQAKAEAQLQQDDQIIRLQEDIVRRAEAQVQNGVMTTTDYLAQLNLLTQARLLRVTHDIQLTQALEMYRARTEKD